MADEAQAIRDFIARRQKWYAKVDSDEDTKDLAKSGSRNYSKQRQSHEERFPFELLQNTHDASTGERAGRARFVWTESALLVADAGKGFSLADVKSLCTSDSERKVGDGSTIGQKGVGFVAVYQFTDFPQIFTHHGVFFGFDLPTADKEKMIAPLWLPHELDLDSYADDVAKIDELRADGAVTIIRLPFRDPTTQYEATFDSCVEQLEPELLLFMPKLKSFSLERGSEVIKWEWSSTEESIGTASVVELSTVSETRSWLVVEDQIPTPSLEHQGQERDQWRGLNKIGCGVAVRWCDGKLLGADEPDPVCVYYPTTDTTGLQFRFHADFLVTENRASIHYSGVQRELQEPIIEQIAIMTAEMCDAIVTKGGRSSAWDLLEFLGHSFELSSPSSGLGQRLFDEVVARLKRLEIVPVVGGALRTADETRVPRDFTIEGYKTLIEETPLRSKSRFVYPSIQKWSEKVSGALRELGTEFLNVDETVSLIESGDGYGAESLYGSLRAVDETLVRNQSVWRQGLRSRPVICATDGTWLCPKDVYFTVEGLPEGADTVLNLDFVDPPSESSREFLEELGIKKPDPEEIVGKLEALVADFPDPQELKTLPDDQAPAKFKELTETSKKILNILGVYWKSENDEYRNMLEQFTFENLFIPVKKVGSTDTRFRPLEIRPNWRAKPIYLDKAWTGNDALERLYGRFERFEFLDHKQLGDLWDPADQSMRDLPLALGMKDKVYKRFDKVDRVTEIVEAPQPASSKALLDLWDDIAPLVEDEDQAETLATQRWVPEGEGFVAPIETWYDRQEPHATKVLPLTPPQLKTGPVQGNDYKAPSLRGLASGLQYLYDLQHLDEEVVATARHFLRRFSEKISQDKPSDSDGPILRHLCEEPPPMPAYEYGEPTWLRTGDIGHFWDLPSDPPDAYSFPTLKDDESALIGLLDIDSVRRASEVMNATPELPSDSQKKGCLEPQQRLAVAALLMKEGIALRELANLSEKHGSELHLRLSAQNFSEVIPCVAYLEIPRSAQGSRSKVDVSGSLVVSDGAAKAQTPADLRYPILWTDMTAKPIDLAMEMIRLFRDLPPERYKQASKDLSIVLSNEQQGWQKLLELDQGRLDEAEEALEKCRSKAASESEENGFADENDPATAPQVHLPAPPADISNLGDLADSEAETIDVTEPIMTNESGVVSHFATDITERDSTKTSSDSEALGQQQFPVRRTPPTSKPKMSSTQPVRDPEAVDDQTPIPVENLERFENVAEEITPATVTSDGYRQSDLRPLVEPDDSWLLRLTSEDSDFEARYDSVSATSSRPSASSRTRDDNRSLAPPLDWRQMEDMGFRHIERILREYFSAINIRDVRHDLGIPGVSRGPGCDLICNIGGVEHYIELKTMGYEEGSFVLTRNERRRLIEHRERYWVMVVSSLRTEMHIIKLVKNLHEKTGFVPVPENEVENYRVPLTLWKRCVDENKHEWNFGPAD